MGLSAPVQAVVEDASNMVEKLVGRILQSPPATTMELSTANS
jgi:hypothetical protein